MEIYEDEADRDEDYVKTEDQREAGDARFERENTFQGSTLAQILVSANLFRKTGPNVDLAPGRKLDCTKLCQSSVIEP